MCRAESGKGGWGNESLSEVRGKKGLKEEYRGVRLGAGEWRCDQITQGCEDQTKSIDLLRRAMRSHGRVVSRGMTGFHLWIRAMSSRTSH